MSAFQNICNDFERFLDSFIIFKRFLGIHKETRKVAIKFLKKCALGVSHFSCLGSKVKKEIQVNGKGKQKTAISRVLCLNLDIENNAQELKMSNVLYGYYRERLKIS